MVDCPEPTAKRVPEAQAPPSCMPSPNRNAPRNRGRPMSPAAAEGVVPNRPVPVPMSRVTRVAVVPMSRACARRPEPLPTETSCRHAEVKPNREWNRVTPSPRPMTRSVACWAPCASQTCQLRASARRPATTTGAVRTGGASGGAGRMCEVGATSGPPRRWADGCPAPVSGSPVSAGVALMSVSPSRRCGFVGPRRRGRCGRRAGTPASSSAGAGRCPPRRGAGSRAGRRRPPGSGPDPAVRLVRRWRRGQGRGCPSNMVGPGGMRRRTRCGRTRIGHRPRRGTRRCAAACADPGTRSGRPASAVDRNGARRAGSAGCTAVRLGAGHRGPGTRWGISWWDGAATPPAAPNGRGGRPPTGRRAVTRTGCPGPLRRRRRVNAATGVRCAGLRGGRGPPADHDEALDRPAGGPGSPAT